MAAVATKKLSQQNVRGLRENEKKWTRPLLEAGWSLIPSVILERQQALGLDPVDMNIVLHIARRWWYADKLPFPSKRELAECIGVDESTIRRHIQRMEFAGLLRRVKRFKHRRGQTSNAYDLSGLIKAVQPYAEEAVKTRANRQAEDNATRTRKRLKLVKESSDE